MVHTSQWQLQLLTPAIGCDSVGEKCLLFIPSESVTCHRGLTVDSSHSGRLEKHLASAGGTELFYERQIEFSAHLSCITGLERCESSSACDESQVMSDVNADKHDN